MSGHLVVVWLGGALSLAAHEDDLRSWAESRLVRLEEPRADAPLSAAGHDDATADRVESLLSEARAGLFGADRAAARAALDAAEALLDRHPDLPESGFLLAELLRTRASVLAETEPEAARALLRTATDLDGALAPPFDSRMPAAPSAERADAPSPVSGSLEPLAGPRPEDVVYVDGRLLRDPLVPTGRHHVRVLRGDHVAWSGWVAVGQNGAILPMRAASPCSTDDLDQVTVRGEHLLVPEGVRCTDWLAVRSVGRARIEVARCRGSRCGPLLPWSRDWGAAFAPPAQPAWPRRPSKDWLLWTAIGVLASTATGLVLWRAGVFESEGPGRERFEFVPPERP